jgi:glycosyltransferase involved in cell wall biosynthesis
MTRLLIMADTVGGVWHYATDLAGALLEHGVEPVLVTMGPRPSVAQKAALPDIDLIETELPLDWLAVDSSVVTEAGRELARLADRLRADIVQLNAPALAAGAAFRQPVVAVAHSCVGTWWQAVRGGRIDPDLAWRAELTSAGLRSADRVVAPSAAFATMVRHCYDLPDRPTVVHNGRRPLPIERTPGAPFAFTAGRLWDEGKNLAALDRAAALTAVPIRAAGPCTGPNGIAVALRHIQTLGTLDEAGVTRQLASAPIFVSAAVYEPFGLAVLEAAQAGCALILSDIPTFRELWDGAAWFVYPHDAEGFARAIDTLAADEELRAGLASQSRERARDYTVQRMTEGMMALYAGLPAAPRALEAA